MRAKKVGIQYEPGHVQWNSEALNQAIKQAYHHYEHLKQDYRQRENWLAQVLEAQAVVKDCSKLAIWKKVKKMEQIQTTTRQVKYGLGKVCMN